MIVNRKKSSAVAISSAFSTLASSGSRSDVTNRRWPWGLFGPLSPACQIHLAPSNGASGELDLPGLVGADPLGLGPIRRLEQAHRPERGLAPGRGRAVLVPDPDLPVARLVRPERLAGIDDGRGLVALDPAAVPEVALVAAQGLGVAGDQHLIGRLLLAAPDGFDDPAQARRLDVDAQGIDEVLATQVARGQAAVGPPARCARASGEGRPHQPEQQIAAIADGRESRMGRASGCVSGRFEAAPSIRSMASAAASRTRRAIVVCAIIRL